MVDEIAEEKEFLLVDVTKVKEFLLHRDVKISDQAISDLDMEVGYLLDRASDRTKVNNRSVVEHYDL